MRVESLSSPHCTPIPSLHPAWRVSYYFPVTLYPSRIPDQGGERHHFPGNRTQFLPGTSTLTIRIAPTSHGMGALREHPRGGRESCLPHIDPVPMIREHGCTIPYLSRMDPLQKARFPWCGRGNPPVQFFQGDPWGRMPRDGLQISPPRAGDQGTGPVPAAGVFTRAGNPFHRRMYEFLWSHSRSPLITPISLPSRHSRCPSPATAISGWQFSCSGGESALFSGGKGFINHMMLYISDGPGRLPCRERRVGI